MVALGSLAQLIRSKNAGPWMLTVDIMFPSADIYGRVVRSGVISADAMSAIFGVPTSEIQIFEYAPANAFKISFPRQVPNGHPMDTDLFGGQQFAPLVNLEVPETG